MSGGRFNYDQHRIRGYADEIRLIIENNTNRDRNKYGDCIGHFFGPETIRRLQEAADAIERAGDMLHHVDYLLCYDYGEDCFHRAWDEMEKGTQ